MLKDTIKKTYKNVMLIGASRQRGAPFISISKKDSDTRAGLAYGQALYQNDGLNLRILAMFQSAKFHWRSVHTDKNDSVHFTPVLLFLTCLFVPLTLAAARDKNLPIPRFATIRSEHANIRVGPGPGYPIEWVVLRPGVPVKITAEFDNWYRINFVDESQGWIHRNMLIGKRTVWVVSADAILRVSSQEDSNALARIEKGVLADLQKCDGLWCQIKMQGFKGWVKRSDLWGVDANEKVN